jgi:hypothetical protein
MEVTRRRGRRRKKLLADLKDRRGYSHLKEEALDLTMWRNEFAESTIENDVIDWQCSEYVKCGKW